MLKSSKFHAGLYFILPFFGRFDLWFNLFVKFHTLQKSEKAEIYMPFKTENIFPVLCRDSTCYAREWEKVQKLGQLHACRRLPVKAGVVMTMIKVEAFFVLKQKPSAKTNKHTACFRDLPDCLN